ncbi:hypothetical protein DPMN_124975 [Dreissena polymorpha]|uniref:C-type lectin domain-containing protein n=2 Tax=Dreissena polymorpha TaxID=45954 RepID=A0A9D4JT26_DREPO|nr:hypothetical protein DPMN_124975 [Dreissena polymorpha]
MSLAERVWVGASNIQGSLMWMATGTPLTYIPWAKGEPIMSVDTAVYCVMKMGNDWYSDKCTHSRPFICEQA